MIAHPRLNAFAWAETDSSSDIIATVNGEPVSATQGLPRKQLIDLSYFSDHDSGNIPASLKEYRMHTKQEKIRYLEEYIKITIRRQWMAEQGILVSDEELQTAWKNSSAIKRYNLTTWKQQRKVSKTLYKSFKEALDPQHFPKEVYRASQIEKYKKHLQTVHQKYHVNFKGTHFPPFSTWAMLLISWSALDQQTRISLENNTSSFDKYLDAEKHRFRHYNVEKFKSEARILDILSETNLELKQCLNEHPLKSGETYSQDRSKCIGGKISEFWKTLYQKAEIQIRNPELRPVLYRIRKPN